MMLRVVDPGFQTRLVDLGRAHTRSLGVPIGGAADGISLALGNALVGNPTHCAALEITLAGPTLVAESKLNCVVYGAPFHLVVGKRGKLRIGKTFSLEPGEELTIADTSSGLRAYFCVAGGFHSRPVLGSRSDLNPIRKGDTLPCETNPDFFHRFAGDIGSWIRNNSAEDDFPAKLTLGESTFKSPTFLRVLPGPQRDWFPKTLPLFPQNKTSAPFKVSKDSNRMGLRLQGPEIPFPKEEMISEPVCPGSIQVTPNGQCIILGVDGQTIGGYPKIAQVISADLNLLGQLRPEDSIGFQQVTMGEAQRIFQIQQERFKQWILRMQNSLIRH